MAGNLHLSSERQRHQRPRVAPAQNELLPKVEMQMLSRKTALLEIPES
jgi:hypothetical protein